MSPCLDEIVESVERRKIIWLSLVLMRSPIEKLQSNLVSMVTVGSTDDNKIFSTSSRTDEMGYPCELMRSDFDLLSLSRVVNVCSFNVGCGARSLGIIIAALVERVTESYEVILAVN